MGRTWKSVLVGVFVGVAPIALLLLGSPSGGHPVVSPAAASAMSPTSSSSVSARSSPSTVSSAWLGAGGSSATPTGMVPERWSRDSALQPRLALASSAGAQQTVEDVQLVSPAQEQADQALARTEVAAEAATSGTGPGGQLGSAVPSTVRQWEDPIARSAARYGLDPNLIAALMMTESGGNSEAVSSKGAIGLMQVMDGTFDPDTNVDDGARILAAHLVRFQSLELALAAYNAGAGAVERYGGVPPYRETRDLVFRVMLRLDLYARSAGQHSP